MRHLRVVQLLALLVTLVLSVAAAGSRADEEYTPSGELSALLSAPGDGGEPLIGSQEREYFDELPVRAAFEKTFSAALADSP